MATRTLERFRALPAYLGGKRRLARLIFALLAEVVARSTWPRLSLVDSCCGGGAIALYAKMNGFDVIAADIAERAYTVGRALIANSTARLTFGDVLDLFVAPDEGYPQRAIGYVPSTFSPVQAAWLDRALARAERHAEPRRSLLRLAIIKSALSWQPMSTLAATDTRAAVTGDYDKVSPRRLGHYIKSDARLSPNCLWRLAEDVNLGVFGGRGAAFKGDAVATLMSCQADVAYLDPPYAGTTAYAAEYRAFDEILGDHGLDGQLPGLDDLLTAAGHIKTVVLSYGGPSLSLDELSLLVGRHRSVRRATAVPYSHLASLATEEHRAANRELIVVATT